MRSQRFVYRFGPRGADGRAGMNDLLGGKGAGLAEMSRLHIPVPPGFTISSAVCRMFYIQKGRISRTVKQDVLAGVRHIERQTGRRFGDVEQPLLVSVRSGAKFSMPGMMDTVLNVGLCDSTIDGLARQTGDARFAYDAYRRLLQMFGDVVMGVELPLFEQWLNDRKAHRGIEGVGDAGLTAEDFAEAVKQFKIIIRDHANMEFPQDPWRQLEWTQEAVFKSWNNPRAVTYRKLNGLPYRDGTAVTVQAMVFGNLGEHSGTGVGFTRNPSTGARELFGEYLANAQGEDVVAGIRTPAPLSVCKQDFPVVFKHLVTIASRLERHYRDVQDIEFTVERGTLYMLQTRSAKRTAAAAIKIAVDMVGERLITKAEALRRIPPKDLSQVLHPVLDPAARLEVVATGLPASPGAVTGHAVFSADEAVARGAHEPVILVAEETSPDDIHGMAAAQGILTARGGMTSHAAVVTRGMGKCCIVGCEALRIDKAKRTITVHRRVIVEGDWLTLDGGTGRVILGRVPTVRPTVGKEFSTLLSWADKARRLGVRANADVPKDAKQAREFRAEGIGLCRTEHMFFEEDRLPYMQAMIMAESKSTRVEALSHLLPMQREDFKGLFREMIGYPVTIRTLDPPLHEFLPRKEDLMVEIARLELKGDNPVALEQKRTMLARVSALAEFNPMLGHRGCRLGITHPEITLMQSRAIFEAACQLKKDGQAVHPEIMIPLVGDAREFHHQWKLVVSAAREVMAQYGTTVSYAVGTMIEVPRAALMAGDIAKAAEFFSFGTNDLTQMTYGFSRDDIAKFLEPYEKEGVMTHDPFASIDRHGVGALMAMAVERGRRVRKDLKIGVCGEHGGDPESIKFCHELGVDYVSCSPYRVPTARLAAAQAAMGIEGTRDD